ncbi:MAG: ATP-NAD kinase family protein [Promethearchaeota archaeon]
MNKIERFKLGFIINPIAGMGGSVGLKGTDGRDVLEKAIKLGAKPSATDRAEEFLNNLKSIKSKILFYTSPKYMGEYVLKNAGFDYIVLKHEIFNEINDIYDTTSEHTKKAAEILKDIENIKIIVFIGGDGTARDILQVVNKNIPCLGIPAGVKIYSSVFSINPIYAASLIMQFLWEEVPLAEKEVVDIDENAYRQGKLVSKIYGYMFTPFIPELTQPSKMGTPDSDLNNQERIAKRIVESLEDDVYYLIGPGTTTKAITELLGEEKTILGFDLLLNKKIIARDLNEKEILKRIKGKKVKLIISLIGRQGFLFGRGNLQLTPKVLRTIGPKNMIIISTRFKLQNIPGQILRIDTRDPKLDEELKGLYKIIVDYDEIRICEVK